MQKQYCKLGKNRTSKIWGMEWKDSLRLTRGAHFKLLPSLQTGSLRAAGVPVDASGWS